MKRAMTCPRIANIHGTQLTPTSIDIELRLVARYGLLIGGVKSRADRERREQLNTRIKRLRELNREIVIIVFSASSPYWGEGATVEPAEEAFLQAADDQLINGWPGREFRFPAYDGQI